MRWDISREALTAWCADIIAKYPPLEVTLFVARLRRVGGEGRP